MEATEFNSPFECFDMGFETAEGLATHQQTHQREVPQQEAPPQAIEQQGAHSQTASGDIGGEDVKQYKCNVEGCDKTYVYRKSLQEHLRNIHATTLSLPYKCLVSDCGKYFASQGGLTSHTSKSHLSDEQKGYKCHVEGCGKAYITDAGLSYHVNAKHPEGGDPAPHKCLAEGCDYASSVLKSLKYHQGPAHGIWRCSAHSCDFECSDREVLGAHRAHNRGTPLILNRKLSFKPCSQLASTNRPDDQSDSEDSENSGDKDSVKSEEDSEPERPYPCPGASCNYRHRAAWGILKHWQASHQGQTYPAQDDSSISQPSSNNGRTPLRSHSVGPQLAEIHSGAHLSNSRSEVVHARSPRTHSSTPQPSSLQLPLSSSPTSTSIVENISTIENRIALQDRTSPMVKEEQRGASMAPPPRPTPIKLATTTEMSDQGFSSSAVFIDIRTNKPKPTTKKLGARAFANMALFNQQDEERDLRPTPRPPLRKKEASVDSAFGDEESSSDSDNELSPTPDTIRSKTVGSAFHSNDPFYNPDDSDADNALTKLTPPAPVLTKPTNADEFMSFSTYITDPLLSSYVKKKKTAASIVKPTEVAMTFHTNAETMPASRVHRLRLWEEEKVRKVAEDKAAEAEAKRKRKRGTCAGAPRVKRKYQWKNGFCERKRPGERAKDKEGGNGDGQGGTSGTAGTAAQV